MFAARLRGYLGRLLVLALASWLVPAAGAATIETVRVSFQPFQGNGGLFVADHDRFFAAQGIRILWVPIATGAEFVPILAQGQLDVGATALSAAFFNAVARGLEIRIVADKGHVAGRGSFGSLLIRRDLAGAVKSVAGLRGRKVAIGPLGGMGHYLLARVLAPAGISPDQVTLVTMPIPASLAALQNGAVDAAIMGPPLENEAIERGVASRLVDLADIAPGEPYAFVFFGPTFLRQNRGLGLRFMTAYLRGVRRYNEGPTPRNVAIIAEYTKIERALVARQGWAAIHADGFVDVAKLRRYQDWLFDIGLVNIRHPVTALADASFAEQATALLGAQGR